MRTAEFRPADGPARVRCVGAVGGRASRDGWRGTASGGRSREGRRCRTSADAVTIVRRDRLPCACWLGGARSQVLPDGAPGESSPVDCPAPVPLGVEDPGVDDALQSLACAAFTVPGSLPT